MNKKTIHFNGPQLGKVLAIYFGLCSYFLIFVRSVALEFHINKERILFCETYLTAESPPNANNSQLNQKFDQVYSEPYWLTSYVVMGDQGHIQWNKPLPPSLSCLLTMARRKT